MSSEIIGFVAFRKGSKRLPQKNGKLLGGKPLYQITLDKLVDLKSKGLIHHVVASTDSAEWQEECRGIYGDEAIVHLRSEAISGDLVNEGEVILDFFKQEPQLQRSAILLVLCTYPFLKTEVLTEIVEKYNSVCANVYAIKEAHHMPQKLLRLNEKGELRPYLFDSMKSFEANTKKLKVKYPVSFYSTGAFLIHNACEVLSNDMNLWNSDKIYGVNDDSFHIDVDTPEDFELAEVYMEYLSRKNI
ncbi:acylneuraminate cytidylyltransferase family protein [Alkalitalea saponilacus]|uniref:CMP-N-acetylneuraminic acid synthetase n=1 Tax=Alkalitalea saponilacus TaxID=889453 RepID=A0A1T5HSB0_9BACT|nr:hypothetical protein [Alkalitalea saponilacus]ASB48304.1 hypothetical protein CDL62_03670 [Alkalitalea saponilacus]SKC23527.1 CMP-N-acetylneuraminic acid synthetase [Alkalitalea saponilacus]